MKKINYFLFLFISAFMVNCSFEAEEENNLTNEQEINSDVLESNQTVDSVFNADFVPEIDHCGPRLIEDFRSFMGFTYGDDEKLLASKLGEFSKGNYSADSAYFIYYYDRLPHVPLQIWVNGKSGKIITIFMEVLSLKSLFAEDLALAKEEYPLADCEAKYMGMTAEEIMARLGEPAEDAVSKQGVRLLTYDSEDFEIAVAFKIYPEENKCSSIAVNWFYNNH